MSLTGVPLLVVTAALTLATAAATVRRWRHAGRANPVIRVLGLLMTEALVAASIGLAVNRSQQFYPSWDALMNRAAPVGAVERYTPGHLDGWLRARLGSDDTRPTVFPWHPPGWATWGLTEAPTVVVPAGYLQHPSWRYPVVVVTSGPHDGWTSTAPSFTTPMVGSAAGPAVLVLARTTRPASVASFAAAMDGALTRDLRVTGHSWAMVTSSANAGTACEAVRRQPGRYPALAVVANLGRRAPVAAVVRTEACETGVPAGVSALVISAGSPERPATAAVGNLSAALVWACRQLPAPMAAPAPLIPPASARHQRHGAHGGSWTPSSGERGSRGGAHGPGQHHR
jgi:hypothetical protein